MKIKRFLLLIPLFLFAVFSVQGQTKSAKQKVVNKRTKQPNILVVMTDQQSATMLSCTGNKWLNTPAVDKLASKGVRFERAYATMPVCLPSRFSLQTGLFPSFVGIRENDEPVAEKYLPVLDSLHSRSLGTLFRNAGYDTYYGGKVHIPTQITNAAPWGYTVISKNEREGLAKDASKFLLNRKSTDKPFLLFTSFINPHDICFDAIKFGNPGSALAKGTPKDLLDVIKVPDGMTREEFFGKYCPPLPANHQPMFGEPYAVDSLIRLRDFRDAVREEWTDEDWRMHRWAYARLTESSDALIGQVLDALEKSGLNENTIVVFTSDHGDNDSSHKLEHKTFFYEEAARIPFIISSPWMKQKGKVDSLHLVSNGLDLLPTLCDLSGIKIPEGLSGRSLKPLLNQTAKKWRSHIFIENQLGYLIHTNRYKYELDDKNGNKIREVFTDLQVDPGETCNMINDAKYSSVIRDLRKELLTHLAKLNIKIIPPGE
ncbi:sulfatase-like hydrolase/transferase [Pedobacter sp. SD-b]|uniref:Sulfatase-like hydrolase/transferase n=1 Tax=Pedobacter segetis TaxID=2793069 RepID=A0ABS1BN12_9SPHI|nr:sulfatase-like hydrolase/transferase [Pedobacter segetis]MBK0383696.1 sulfatase-like hydrolase/transferase [Pedobacter segetis]